MYSFRRDTQRIELQACIRRLADLTSPNLKPLQEDRRTENRYNRSLPLLILPYERGSVVAEDVAFAFSKDVSDHGMAIVTSGPYNHAQIVIGTWLVSPHNLAPEEDPLFFLGEVRQDSEIGGGYWQLGIELKELLKSPKLVAKLRPLAWRLLPPALRQEVASTV